MTTLQGYAPEQLLTRAHEVSQWAQVRARELHHFTARLAARLADAGGDPQKVRTQLFAFRSYVDNLQEQVDHARAVVAELERRHGEG